MLHTHCMATRTRSARTPAVPPPNPRRRWRFIAAAVAAALVALASGAVYLTRGATKVTVDQAVRSYRAQAGTPAAPPRQAAPARRQAAPAARTATAQKTAAKTAETHAAPKTAPAAFAYPLSGVYSFATQGYEETDALNGQRHDYPKETSLTIRRAGCGWISHWQPLNERWEDSEICE